VSLKRILATRDHLFEKENWKEQIFTEYCRHIKDNLLISYYNGLKEMKNGKGQFW